MRRRVVYGLTIIAAIALGPVIGIAAPKKIACNLLTTAQVGAALGSAVGVGKPMTKEACQWSQPGKGDDLLKLEVSLTTLERYNRFKTDGSATITTVGNLGDDAYYSTRTKDNQTALVIKKSETAVIIHVFGGKKPTAECQSIEKAIAEAILPGL